MVLEVKILTTLSVPKFNFILQLCLDCLDVDQLAKPILRSRHAHTPFGSAPVPTSSS